MILTTRNRPSQKASSANSKVQQLNVLGLSTMPIGHYFVIFSSAWTAKGSGMICQRPSGLSCSNDVADSLTPSLTTKKAGFAQGTAQAIPLMSKNMLLDVISVLL